MSSETVTEQPTIRRELSSDSDTPPSLQLGNHDVIETALDDGVKSPTTTTFVIAAELEYIHRKHGRTYLIVNVETDADDRLVPVLVNSTEEETVRERFQTTKLPNVAATTLTIDSVKESETIDTDSDAKTVFLTGRGLKNGVEFITGVYHSQKQAEQASTVGVADEYRIDATSKTLSIGPKTFDTHIIGDCRAYSAEDNSRAQKIQKKAGQFILNHDVEDKLIGLAALSALGGFLALGGGAGLSMSTSLMTEAELNGFLSTVAPPLVALFISGFLGAFVVDAIQKPFPTTYSLIDTSISSIAENITTRTVIEDTHVKDSESEFTSTTAKFTPTNTGLTITATINGEIATWRFKKNQAGFLPEDVRDFVNRNPVVTEANTTPITVKNIPDEQDSDSKWVSENGNWEITQE